MNLERLTRLEANFGAAQSHALQEGHLSVSSAGQLENPRGSALILHLLEELITEAQPWLPFQPIGNSYPFRNGNLNTCGD